MPRILSLDKSLSLLEAVMASPEGIGTRALMKQLGYNVATVHNIATTFRTRGYLHQDPETRHFLPGARLTLLGQHPHGLQHLSDLAAPIVERLAANLNESVLLARIEGHRVINLKYIPGRQALRVHEPEDVSDHSYCTAFGKVLLSTLSEEDLNAYLRETKLLSLTPATISKPATLKKELQHVRKQGFARTVDEYCEGISAVAVPIRDPWGAVVASIGASAPTLRIKKKDRFSATLAALKDAASEIEGAWSGSPESLSKKAASRSARKKP